jgi:chemotaxis protein methyltransferase CheR
VNVTDAVQTRSYRDFDIIFCRNLLIYFDDMSRREAADTFYDALVPGGFICLGHSESMSRISPLFKARKFPDCIVYQKPTSS